jgi:prophage tail gpP-like protein
VSVSGRDATGALVDCSAILDALEFRNIGILELCQKLASPFDIRVSLQQGIADKSVSFAAAKTSGTVGGAAKSSAFKSQGPLDKETINPGESPFDIIDRACRKVGLLATADGVGGLVLARGGALRARVALVEGENILEASIKRDASKRYRRYVVSGQNTGDDENNGADVADVSGEAFDNTVRRASRVVWIRAEGNMTKAFAQQRAAWEAAVRTGRSTTAEITVQGWRQGEGGPLWPINAIVPVRSPELGIDGDMLITATSFELSVDGGELTTLTLAPPNAFTPEPTIAKSTVAPWSEDGRL